MLSAIMKRLRRDDGEHSMMQVITIAVSAILLTAGMVTFPGIMKPVQETTARTLLAQIVILESEHLGKHGAYSEMSPDLLRDSSLRGSEIDERAGGCNSDVTSCTNIAIIPGFASSTITPAEQGQYNCYSLFVRTKDTVFYYQSRAIGNGEQIFELATPDTDVWPGAPAAIDTATGEVASQFPSGYSICHGNPYSYPANWWPSSIEQIPWN